MKIKLSEEVENEIKSICEKVNLMYNERELASEMMPFISKIHSIILNELYNKFDKKKDYFEMENIVSKNKYYLEVNKLYQKRRDEQKKMTVGDLIHHLSKFNPNLPIKIESYVECITDAGSDLGGMEDHSINEITNLETKVVISIERDW